MMHQTALQRRKQVLYWRLLNQLFADEPSRSAEETSAGILDELGLPQMLLNPRVLMDNLIQRYPELEPQVQQLRGIGAPASLPATDSDLLRKSAIYTKMLLNVFANAGANVTAEQYNNWCADVAQLETAFGYAPGQLRGKRGGVQSDDDDLADELKAMEGELIKRMRLREVLGNNALAAKMTPSMPLVEQLLRDKANLSGVALQNAKRLIRGYISEVANILRTEVEKASVGEIDHSVPPKRVFQNLDLKRTIWKNLTNWDPVEERLYVDRLYYHRTSRKQLPSTMIVVVDQSGSMVDSMVNCTILASIFAGLPRVDPHLIAYDTKAIDLTSWVCDPFEVLLRTNLGGGNDWSVVIPHIRGKVTNPRKTVLIWISDYYEVNTTQLFNQLRAFKNSGIKFIPVGSVTSSGSQIVNPWFRKRFKDLECPIISGNIKKLIVELKKFLNT